MDIHFFYTGLLIGFSIAAPVGPIGVLCIKRTLSSGWVIGLLSGLGAATADAFYGSVAAFGLTFISGFLLAQQNLFRLVGGAFLCYLGIRTVLSRPSDSPSKVSPINRLEAYGTTFLLTLTNPLTILSFAAIFAGFGLASLDAGYSTAAITVLGVFLGSSCWWLILSGVTSLLRSRISFSGLQWINRISGVILLAFGILAIISVIQALI